MRLKNRLLIIFLVISIIPVTCFTFFTYSRYSRMLDRQIEEISDNLVERAAEEADRILNEVVLIQETICYDAVSQQSFMDSLYQYDGSSKYSVREAYKTNQLLQSLSQNLFRSYPYLNGIYVFTPSGEEFSYSTKIAMKYDYEPFGDEWYKKTLELDGKTYIDGISQKDFLINGEESVSFSMVIKNPFTQKKLGVLYIDCSPDMFDLSRVNTIPEQACLAILDGEDELYSNGVKVSENKIAVYNRTLDMEGLSLRAEINHTALKEAENKTLLLLVAFWGICILVFLALSFLLSHSITHPIEYLSGCMSRHDTGMRVKDEPSILRKDEIGVLYREYDAMIVELDHYIKNELQNKVLTLNAQMRSLEAQINAHFLYNTLEAISSLAAIEGVKDISTMAEALSDMFRYSIKTESAVVPLSEELVHVQNYVAIQQIRFDHGFKMEMNIPKELMEEKILKLILQPFVENALFHGLQSCNYGTEIRLTIRKKEKNLRIEISDDGIGMKKELLEELRASLAEPVNLSEFGGRKKKGIGIKNINSRIQLYYGNDYGVRIESAPLEGSRFIITIPLAKE